jgi:hypothetical protein
LEGIMSSIILLHILIVRAAASGHPIMQNKILRTKSHYNRIRIDRLPRSSRGAASAAVFSQEITTCFPARSRRKNLKRPFAARLKLMARNGNNFQRTRFPEYSEKTRIASQSGSLALSRNSPRMESTWLTKDLSTS